jgi:hypothetical protein
MIIYLEVAGQVRTSFKFKISIKKNQLKTWIQPNQTEKCKPNEPHSGKFIIKTFFPNEKIIKK